MKEIILANNKGIILVDDVDYDLLSKFKWFLPTKDKYPTTGVYCEKSRQKLIRMFKLIIKSIPDGMEIIYINNNRLDNRRSNLKLINCSERWKETTEKIRIANSGVNAPWYGKQLTKETKEKLSLSHKGIVPWNKNKKCPSIVSAMHRPDVRKKHLKALSETKWLGMAVDKGQIEMLEKWNRLGFNFIPNYQIHTDEILCYLDGYDKEHNVVFEYDSKYHKRQKEKDLIRQNKIIDILKPNKFWRYDAVTKQFKNVLIK